MDGILPFIIGGVATGAIYGLAGTGLVLTYKTSGVFNFGYAEGFWATDWGMAIRNTFKFAIVSVVLETILGVVFALVLNAEFKGRSFVRAAVLVPWAIPTIVSAKMWAWIMHDQFGVMNALLHSRGTPS